MATVDCAVMIVNGSCASDELSALIRAEIEQHGGWLPFDRFMQMALFAPRLGYYERTHPIGATGDYITAPQLGELLAKGLADCVRWAHQALGAPSDWWLVEQGGGDGSLLAQLLAELDGLVPSRIYAIERSKLLRKLQKERFAKQGMPVEVVKNWHELAPHDAVIFFSNELLDAFPVRCFVQTDAGLHERGVSWDEHAARFVWRTGAPMAPPPTAERYAADWPAGYLGEWCPYLKDWRGTLARTIERGVVITIDYGYPARELYRPTRIGGTLMAHHKHQAHEDVLASPGEQDITAHVDFTAVAKAAAETGFAPIAFTTQGAWLAQSPSVQRALQEAAQKGDVRRLAEARRLLMPQGMGETFKILIDSRPDIEIPSFLQNFQRLKALF